MNPRRWLIYNVLTTVGEELLIALAALVVLPRLGVFLPWQVVAGVMAVLACWAVIGYYMGVSVIGRRPTLGKEAMKGKIGVVIKPLSPIGLVKIEGELWQAKSEAEHLSLGEEVIVMAQEGIRLVVKKTPPEARGVC